MSIFGKRSRWVIAIVFILAIGGAVWFVKSNLASSTTPTYETSTARKGDLEVTISAAGTLALKEMVEVGAQVSGQLEELFVDVADSSFEGDRQTGKRDTQAPFTESIQEAIECLDNDEEYREEYRQFVDAMSYADDDESVDFDSAVEILQEVAALFE